MIIAVDAMGGDNAPEVVIHGAIEACEEFDANILLVGDRKVISSYTSESSNLKIHHCEEAVGMDESPIKAVRSKKDSSIRVAFDLLKNSSVDAVVSAGNSGAVMAAGVLVLGKLNGVERPALASVIPCENGKVIIIDVGGNVDCRPVHLLQFGIMAEAFATSCLNMRQPRSGLLNIGTEKGKGNDQVRAAYDLLSNSSLNFAGNVEGSDILSGDIQIVICDGFTGNIILKFSEGMVEFIHSRLRRAMEGDLDGKIAPACCLDFVKRFGEGLDYAEYGGAPILGIRGVGIVCHGDSSAKAIKNAIKMAMDYVSNKTEEKLAEKIAEIRH